MVDESKGDNQQGWTEAALSAVIAWFPDLPKWVRVCFASATIYLVLCLVAQVSPVALFEALSGGVREWVHESRTIAAEERGAAAKERADLISLLMEQNRELRDQAERDPRLAERVTVLERRMEVLLDQHPQARIKARAPPD